MSDPKRYYLDDYGVLIEHPCGEYSHYEDYAQLKAEREWQPIETAPKDGTEVLICQGDKMAVGSFCYEDGTDTAWTSGSNFLYGPTHWMPLPKPPAAKEDGQPTE